MKVAYVGIDILYPVLTSLYDTGCEIIKIVTCKTDNYTEFNTKTIEFAKKHNIPYEIKKLTTDDLYELVSEGCEFVLFGGYYHKVPVIPELRIVNTHPALLPFGRGAWPMPLTILKGLKESGVTMHQMEKELDTGKIILQEKCPVYPDKDDLISLTERQWSLIPAMVKRLVSDFDNLWNNAYPQEGNAQYWEMPAKEDFTVTSDMSFDRADLILRAFKSYEVFYTDKDSGRNLELIDACAHRTGELKSVPKDALKIKDGYIVCERIREI